MGNRRVGRAPIAACMTCPLCKDILEEATTISLCLHAFCKKCIYGRFSDEELDTCPVCDAYLGATPEDKLRPDHNLQALQGKIFPLKKTGETSKSASPSGPPPSRRKAKSTSSLDAAKTKRRSKSGCKKTKGPSNSSLNKADNEDETAKPPSSPESVNRTIPIKKLILKLNKPCNETKSAEDGAIKSAAPEKNIDSDQLIKVGVTRLHLEDKPVWFSLVASEDEEEAARLPQLSSRFLRIKTAKMAVSYIQKYIAKKFELAKEDEVVIKFQGEALLPSTLVCEVEERWIRHGLGLGLALVQTKVGRSAEEYVMPLTYSRARNQAHQPSL